jgi:hypothetical protein
VLQSESVIAVPGPKAVGNKAGGKWVGREGFVAEAAVQFDRINATIARLERELERSKATVAEMTEEANRNRRFQAFEVSLENSRYYKITDLQRTSKDVKGRLDAIEGERSTFAGLTYKSFSQIDRRLAELGALLTQVERAEIAARRNEVLFFGALAVAAIALASRFVF